MRKTAAAPSAGALIADLTPGEVKGIAAALGIGALFALFRTAARSNQRSLDEQVSAMRMARAERDVIEEERAHALAAARRHTESAMRMRLAGSGINVMHPSHDPFEPSFIAEAARRNRPLGVVEF